jgi:hypothetical protein
MTDIVHHRSPVSAPCLLLSPPTRDFEGVGSGVTAFQTTVSDESIEGKAVERLVMTNRTARASRLFRSRKAASLGRGLRKSRKVRLLFVIVSVQLDRGHRRGSDRGTEKVPQPDIISLTFIRSLSPSSSNPTKMPTRHSFALELERLSWWGVAEYGEQ